MKRKPLNNHGLCTLLPVFAFLAVMCNCVQSSEMAVVSERRSQPSEQYTTLESNGSSEILVTSIEAGGRSEISADVGDTVYIGCNGNRTTGSSCEWYKKEANGETKLRILYFVGRYLATSPCKLQIRPVVFEDEGTFICKVKTAGLPPVSYYNQLTVTGQEDPFKNVHVKKAVYTSLSPSSPDSEPAISMDSLVKNGVYTVEPGDSVLVRCGATGNPKPLVMWRRGSQNYTKITEGRSDLKIAKPTTDDAGTYHCEAVNIFGKVEHAISIAVRASLNAASEIIDITPRNLSIFEGKLANLTCIARFEAQPFIRWVKRVENRTTEPNTIIYEGHLYSVFQQAETRTLGQHLYASTLLFPNVTIANSGQYFCVVAGGQGYNFSEAHIVVERDPFKDHILQTRKHKMITLLWVGAFLCVSIIVVLTVVRLCGCPNAASTKSLHLKPGSDTTSSLKTQLPKRSPETLSTECANTRNESFHPLVGNGSCSFVSRDPSIYYKDYSSSCRTYNSYDPEFSLSVASSTNSVVMANLEAARSSCSNCKIHGSKGPYANQSVASPTEMPYYYPQRQRSTNHNASLQASSVTPHVYKYPHRFSCHVPTEVSQEPYLSHGVELKPGLVSHKCMCPDSYCEIPEPSSTPTSYYDDYPSPSNLLLTSDSEWYPQEDRSISPQSSYFRHPTSFVDDPSESDSYHEDEEPEVRYGIGTNHHGLLHPSPNLSFLEQLRSNPNSITAIL